MPDTEAEVTAGEFYRLSKSHYEQIDDALEKIANRFEGFIEEVREAQASVRNSFAEVEKAALDFPGEPAEAERYTAFLEAIETAVRIVATVKFLRKRLA